MGKGVYAIKHMERTDPAESAHPETALDGLIAKYEVMTETANTLLGHRI